MASPLTHAVVGATIAASHGLSPRTIPPWWLAMFCAIAPDVDAIGYWLGVPYESFWGHRGFTHSIAFALMISWVCARWSSTTMSRFLLWSAYFTAALSHGLLDAFTDGGLGVAFFSPVDPGRYLWPVRPIHVSSMSLRDLLGSHGLDVLVNEMRWVWLPCGVTLTILWWWNRRPRSIQRDDRSGDFGGKQ
ncbi:MAG TPA: metal-dependent hydrolase [Nitrospira sp.]|nr:metal-dependent hydrolase [Nitrospira sp.]